MNRGALALAILVCALPGPAQAWWEYGHETVARIAWANVRPSTRAAIARLFRAETALGTPECRVTDLASASVWADCIKPLKDPAGANRFGYAYNWHFQNIDICQPFALPEACTKGDCVSAAITAQTAILADRRAAPGERLRALAFVTHFVGDLHQPLHAGDRGDLGGNRVAAPYGIVASRRANLHLVWDGWLAERAITTPPGARALMRLRRGDGEGSVADWSRENHAVARRAYDIATGGQACAVPPTAASFDEARIATAIPIVRDQLRKGGARLARLLDTALTPRTVMQRSGNRETPTALSSR